MSDTWDRPVPRCPLESTGIAEWRGQITQQTNDTTRRVDAMNGQLEHIRRELTRLREDSVATRAKASVIVGIAAFLGSGVAGSLVLVLLHKT